MAQQKTSISAGLIVYDLLSKDEAVRAKATKIYPLVADNPVLPYVFYAVTALTQDPTKAGYPGADKVEVQVACCTTDYAEGADLAEAVRAALDHRRAEKDGMTMRSCTLTDYNERWENDAFIRYLVFTIKI